MQKQCQRSIAPEADKPAYMLPEVQEIQDGILFKHIVYIADGSPEIAYQKAIVSQCNGRKTRPMKFPLAAAFIKRSVLRKDADKQACIV